MTGDPDLARADIATVLGTRPEIIKLAPIVRALGRRARVIHTGQHWDDTMSGQHLREQGMPKDYERLSGIGSASRAAQIGSGIEQIGRAFEQRRPKAVIVQGDTNSTSMGAQAASYLGIPLIHVEAGLRSYDRGMPEEINRLVVGALADLHCAATTRNADNLILEGVDPARIRVTGNTVVEATLEAMRLPAPAVPFPPGGPFVLATVHRPENTDDGAALRRIVSALARLDLPVVLIAHPRTEAALRRFGISEPIRNVRLLRSVSHAQFLALMAQAALVISDSGGVQEEVTVLKKPLLVVRRSTERPESIDAGFARLVGPDDSVVDAAAWALDDPSLMDRLQTLPSPYGDGSAGTLIAALAVELADRGPRSDGNERFRRCQPLFGSGRRV